MKLTMNETDRAMLRMLQDWEEQQLINKDEGEIGRYGLTQSCRTDREHDVDAARSLIALLPAIMATVAAVRHVQRDVPTRWMPLQLATTARCASIALELRDLSATLLNDDAERREKA